ncbi:uncharacterized protein LOC128894968 isoform X1 [Hylaeus anthracinus]|uniref:uncharacterized protein LOC128894968 isoform X1 n=1 Tax=Hylaeus anthracinus TaxID=313031 RepID=UPI0023B8DF5E|nr:uncharacterized protein LOC128894968 isoform X1 [Hylaeus anthracinus]
MGTMRNNFAEAFVLLLVLMLPTSQSFPHGKESSSRRNSLTNTLTSKVRSAHSSISGTTYECLFVDEKLPTCDVKWMLNSKEDTANSTSGRERRDLDARLDKVTESRPRSNFDPSKVTRVIVYTFEGCLPPIRRDRLYVLMPPCDGISLDKIVGVERFYPFAMKGTRKPPPVLPEVTRDQWLRMMVRLRNHVSSKARNFFFQKHHGVPVSKEATTTESSYELAKATQPNAGPQTVEKTEPTMDIDHERSSPSSSDVVVDDLGNKAESPPKKKSLNHFRRKIPNKYVHQRETIVLDGGKSSLGDKKEDLVEIPSAPFAIEASKASTATNPSVYKKMAVDEPSDDFASPGDSERFSTL